MNYKEKVKKEAWSIPNLLSYFRILLIPLIVWLYVGLGDYYLSVIIVVLSGITDVIDGKIARKFDMVTDWGKFIDPVADKLTQAAIIFCLSVNYKLMLVLIVLFAVKELYVVRLGMKNFQLTGEVESARWFGKLNTVLLYLLMGILMLFPTIPEWTADIFMAINAFFIVLSWIMYARFYRHIRLQNKESKEARKAGKTS